MGPDNSAARGATMEGELLSEENAVSGGKSPRAKARRKGPRKTDDKKEYFRKKRPPRRPSQRPNDIYVTRRSEFSKQLARCHQLLEQGCNEVVIHGLGMAMHRAINLALQLQDTATHSLQLSTTTSTVELVDDLEPLDDDVEYQTQSRNSSAIQITLTKAPLSPPPPPLPTTPPAATPSV